MTTDRQFALRDIANDHAEAWEILQQAREWVEYGGQGWGILGRTLRHLEAITVYEIERLYKGE